MTTEGRLADRDFAEIVQELGAQRWSGVLTLERETGRIRVTVEQGRMVFASSSNPDHRLGALLLRRGVISLRQLQDAGNALVPGKRLGTILVERGQLAPKDLVRAVVDQTREIVLEAFQWAFGTYELEAGGASSESITLNISPPELILAGISRIEAWSRVERGCGGLAARYARPPGTEEVVRDLPLSEGQRALVAALVAPRDVESLCAESSLCDFEVCRTLWALRVMGALRRVEAASPLDDDGLEYVLPPPADGGGS